MNLRIREWWNARNDVTRGMLVTNGLMFVIMLASTAAVSFGQADPKKTSQYVGAYLAVSMAGTTLGWLLGAIVSPLNKDEAEFKKLFASFLTGAFLVKVTDWLPKLFPVAMTLTMTVGILLFIAEVSLGFVTVYIFRRYYDSNPVRSVAKPDKDIGTV